MKTKFLQRLSLIGAAIMAILIALGYAPKPDPGPVPTPTPVASPSPTAEPSALPTPPPIPSETPTPAACRLPPSDGHCTFPPEGISGYEGAVNSAQAQAKENGYLVPGGQVKDETLYTNEVARLLRLDGYCAINGRNGGHTSDDEVWVKMTNSYSEHFDIIDRNGYPITLFAARCIPAKF